MRFAEKLARAVEKSDSLLCVALDPDFDKLPESMPEQFGFCKAIIDATHDLVSSYKINPAFFEARGADGVAAMKQVCDYLGNEHPDLPIILDGKRGDIGNSNAGYVKYIFDYLRADATTVSPYMGAESLGEFIEHSDKGIFVLCRTSNPGAGEFQDLRVGEDTLYLHVAKQVAGPWNEHGNCSLVVGATYPEELREIRQSVGPDMPLLVPGVGTQGGDVGATVAAGIGANNRGLIILAARAVLFASSGEDFAEAARAAAMRLRDEINGYRKEIAS